jgi:hypothetical protein
MIVISGAPFLPFKFRERIAHPVHDALDKSLSLNYN